MLTRPTVLVLGAGASAPFGFKLGADLSHNIVKHLLPGNALFNDLVTHGGVSEEAIARFRKRFLIAGRYSIDAFLERKDEQTVWLGKMALAHELITDEDPERVFRFQENWMREMYVQLNTGFDDFEKNTLSIITFNYDRSVEHFLFGTLMSENENEKECREVIKAIPIIHLHGKLGYLDWQDGDPTRPYETSINPTALKVCVESIKVIHEAEPDDEDFKRAKELLAAADKIAFLGFGYSPTNLTRLDVAKSYAGFWVTRRSGGVVCRHFDDLDAVLESDTGDDLRQLICAFQPAPSLRCGAE